jgi:hypothetical protein
MTEHEARVRGAISRLMSSENVEPGVAAEALSLVRGITEMSATAPVRDPRAEIAYQTAFLLCSLVALQRRVGALEGART